MMNKRAQELSLRTIIIAILAILALIVLVLILTGTANKAIIKFKDIIDGLVSMKV